MKLLVLVGGLVLIAAACGKKEDSSSPAPSTPPVTAPTAPAALTYTSSVKAIIDAKCVNCHKAGGSGSFLPLDTHARVAAAKADSKLAINGGTMPKASSSAGPLTAAEKTAIISWIDAGAPN